MPRLRLRCAAALLGAALACASGAAASADPLVLFLLRMLRDQLVSSAIESGIEAARKGGSEPRTPHVPPAAPSAEGQWLRALIDESFVHLGAAQREELHASLVRILADPKNAPERATILAEFTRQAIAVRDAHRALSRLSPEQMRAIAAEARVEFERLPREQREQMLQALGQGIPGVPQALNEILLAEFAGAAGGR